VAYSYDPMMPRFGYALLPRLLGIGLLEVAGLTAVLLTATR
jgi:hypothetical protein